uniref:Uncharacterized protein n=1 Tax=viral metagenome TaxID=1070528 RepID=A0A6C0B921_9ZZZZ
MKCEELLSIFKKWFCCLRQSDNNSLDEGFVSLSDDITVIDIKTSILDINEEEVATSLNDDEYQYYYRD